MSDIAEAVTAAQKRFGLYELASFSYSSLGDFMDQVCVEYAEHNAFQSLGTNFSYKDWQRAALNLAAFLRGGLCLSPDDKIIVQLPNIVQQPIATYACAKAGLVVVNVNPVYSVDEFRDIAIDSGANAIITSSVSIGVIAPALADTSIEHVIVTEVGDMLAPLRRFFVNSAMKLRGRSAAKQPVQNLIYFTDALKQGANLPVPHIPEDRLDKLAVLQYTGGTTGRPKGAMLSHRNLLSNMAQFGNYVTTGDIRRGAEVMVMPMPLYHVYAFTVSLVMLYLGANMVLIADPRNKSSLIKALRKQRFSFFCGLNTLFVALTADARFCKLDFSALKGTLSGGMALTDNAAKRWKQVTGCDIWEGYGLSEASPLVAANPGNAIQIGSIGVPAPGTQVRIVDDSGADLNIDCPGELWVKGPQVMQAYWNQAEATAAALDADGWLKTGDIAVVQADGFLRIVDRKKDLIIVSGFKVYPSEVEHLIAAHPDVNECAVIGIADTTKGEVVKVFIVSDKADLNFATIQAYCRQHLAPYKIPQLMELRDELPKSPVGKVLRKELR